MLPVPENYTRLLEIRQQDNLVLKQCALIKSEVKLRNYQAIGVYHLIACSRMVLGDAAGLGKTLQSLASFCYQKEKNHKLKLLVIASKSALYQWKSEVEKFTVLSAQVIGSFTVKVDKVVLKSGDSRKHQISEFFKNDIDIMVMNYNTLIEEYETLIPQLGEYMVIFDEASYFKNQKTITFRAVQETSVKAKRSIGLSATIIKNRLEEAFSIYSAIVPGLFKNITQFRKDYCRTVLMPMVFGKVKRKIPKVVGYKNLNQFRTNIDPYFLGRKKEDVAKELPVLISKTIELELKTRQEEIYQEALQGVLNLDSGEEKKVERLSALIYCQQISNSPNIVGIDAESSKEEELFRLLEDELIDEKVIIFTNFKKQIDRFEALFKKRKIRMTRITGDENSSEREENKKSFQDKESGVNVIFINRAGSESINLQIASTFIFFDNPWSYGDYLQLVGRAQRIGSEHSSILVLHLVNRKTIDEHVLKTLKSKQGLVASVFGEMKTGELAFEEDFSNSLFNEMVRDAYGR